MNDHGWDIERIVSEVLRRLQSHVPPTDSAPPAEPKTKTPKTNGRRELCLEERVVTLAVIKDRLQGVRHLRLRPDAVVTPSARDEFRKRNIAVQRQKAPEVAGEPASPLLIAVAETDFDPSPLLAQVAGTSIPGKDLVASVRELAKRVRGDTKLGVLLTSRKAPALCLANRFPGVRAALGDNVGMVREALESVAVNLLVVDPANRGLADLAGTLREFSQGGPRACPPEFREVL